MAITYAWRLDANKYAYIVSPTGVEGYATDTPESGDKLATIAKTANEWYGEGGSKGFSGYTAAFNKMKTAIKNKWGNSDVEYYDLLSADVYYNVDAATCADLRGVGIRGIRYLGVCDVDSWKPENPSWDPTVKQYDATNIAGKFSIYGIYMEDQYENDDLSKNPTPENIFAVYNGSDGAAADGGDNTATLTAKLESEVKERKEKDSKHSSDIAKLQQQVDSLSKVSGGSIVDLVEQVDELYNQCIDDTSDKYLKIRVAELEAQVSELNKLVQQFLNPDSGTGTGGTGNATISYSELNEGEYGIVVADDGSKLYCVEGIYVNVEGEGEGKKISLHAPGFYQTDEE